MAEEIEILEMSAVEALESLPDGSYFLLKKQDHKPAVFATSLLVEMFAAAASLSDKADLSLVEAIQEAFNTLAYQVQNIKLYDWLSGTTDPGSSTGVDGQFYLNTVTGSLYKKTEGAWVFVMALGEGGFEEITNEGAFSLAVPSTTMKKTVLITNAAGAGTITTSSFTKVTGDSFTTTVGHAFMCTVTKLGTKSLLSVTALQ